MQQDDGRRDVAHARRSVALIDPESIRPGGPSGPPRRTTPLQRFGRRYGWRAYALPLLIAITIVALLNVGGGKSGSGNAHSGGTNAAGHHGTTPTVPPVASGNTSLKVDTPGANALQTVLTSGALPAGGGYTIKGDGTFRVIKGTSAVVGSAGKLYRYDIEVENGVTGIDLTQFASSVQTVLADPRSWSGHGVRLQRVDSGKVDFHVSLTSVDTDHAICGYSIPVETSCYAPAGTNGITVNRVVLEDARWVRGAMAYVGDLTQYRIYMINHEDGHALGHEHAHSCLPGGDAPAMMQQTIGLKSAQTGQMCTANPWPYPPGVSGAPGAEEPDTDQNSEFVLTGD